MRNQGLLWCLLFQGAAAGAAWTLVIADLPVQAESDRRHVNFQNLVGGLGFGPAQDLAHCPFHFDPRLGRCRQDEWGPLADGASLCPHHGGSVFCYPPLKESLFAPVTSEGDVEIP